MNTGQLHNMLQRKYGPPEYVFLSEVRNGTGFARHPRTADALAFNLWPSRGMELLGFELKVSRQDWKKELINPEKAEAIAQYCDRWWIIAGDEKVVGDTELPATWGLQVATSKGLTVIRDAPTNPALKPLDRHFMWACLRQYGTGPADVIEAARRAGREDGFKDAEQKHLKAIERLRADYTSLQQRVSQFQIQSGLDIAGWGFANAIEVAKFLQKGGVDQVRKDLAHLKQRAADIAESIDAILSMETT